MDSLLKNVCILSSYKETTTTVSCPRLISEFNTGQAYCVPTFYLGKAPHSFCTVPVHNNTGYLVSAVLVCEPVCLRVETGAAPLGKPISQKEFLKKH